MYMPEPAMSMYSVCFVVCSLDLDILSVWQSQLSFRDNEMAGIYDNNLLVYILHALMCEIVCT